MNRIKKNKRLLAIVSFLLLLSSTLLSFVNITSHADSNPATWVMCKTEDGQILYNAATTDLVPYSIRSKSSVASTQRLDSFLNEVMASSGFDFVGVNEAILGRPTRPKDSDQKENESDEKEKPNENTNAKAEKVNPFDRFGVAGLYWSSYSGEWKYYETDGCADGNEASKTEFGKFYENRKEPKASFNEISGSQDPRVIQYSKGVFASWTNAFNGTLTNGLFNITKTIVAFTITLISYSFTDISELIGFGDKTNGFIGLFNNLYNGLFLPMVTIAFLFTAIYIAYYGLIKRQIRQALINGLGQSIICLLFASVIAGNASFWIPFPNRIATYGEAVVISALGQSSEKGGQLCSTNVGVMTSGKDSINLDSDSKSLEKQMEKIGQNMKSTIGCRMWEEFLFKPWVRGQFGTEYSDLYVAGTPNAKLKNVNSEWTKSADVPLGGDTVEHNLALFQLSAQTEAHAPLSGETGNTAESATTYPALVDGVNADWWRVADILSNYDEEEVTKEVEEGQAGINITQQKQTTPLSEWQTWIGNRPLDRYSTALLSILFGGLGSIGPLVFGLLTAIYSIGITLLMAVAPLFLLFGCWAGRGQLIFRGWLEALVSTMIKKVVAAALLLISFVFSINTMNMIDKVGWLKSFVLLFVVTIVLVKSRKQIMDMFSKVSFGGLFRPDQYVRNRINKHQQTAKKAGLIGLATGTGAYHGAKTGMGALAGAKLGAGHQLQNTLRQSQMGRNSLMTYTQMTGAHTSTCSICGNEIKHFMFLDEYQNPICSHCASDMGMETELHKVDISNRTEAKDVPNYKQQLKKIQKQRLITRNITKKEHNEIASNTPQIYDNPDNKDDYKLKENSWLSFTKMGEVIDLNKDKNSNLYWNNEKVINMIDDNLIRLDLDFERYEEMWRKSGDIVIPPAVPEPLEKYVSSSLINEAWHSGKYDEIKDIYREAWSYWYIENSFSIKNITTEERNRTIQIIENLRTEPDVTNDSKKDEN